MKTLLKDKEAIHCPTEELARQVLKVLHEDGYVWQSRDSLLNKSNWEEYRSETVYLTENSWINYGMNTGYTRDMNYTIIPAEEFLERLNKWSILGGYDLKSQNIKEWSGNPHRLTGDAKRYYNFNGTELEWEQTSKPKYTEITIEQFKKHRLKLMNKYKLKVEYPGSPKVGTITEEDMSKYPDFWEVVKEPYEVGAYLKVLRQGSRYATHNELARELNVPRDSKIYYNAPNTEYIKFVRMASFSNEPKVIIGEHNGYYYAFGYNNGRTLKEVSKEEYESYQQIEVAGYTLERVGSNYKFGCQTFDKAEVKTIKRLLESPINAEITISGTKITQELINKL